jgi:hypothetical protein
MANRFRLAGMRQKQEMEVALERERWKADQEKVR